MSNKITVNGITTVVSGRDIVVRNGKITVGGVLVAEGLSGEVNVKFDGDLASLDATHVDVSGNVMGDVDCTSLTVRGNIGGSVDGTNITANDIAGDVDGTNITANVIKGNVDGVSIKTRK